MPVVDYAASMFHAWRSPCNYRPTSAIEGDDSVVLRHVAHGHHGGAVHCEAGQALLQIPPGIVGEDVGAVLVSHRQQGLGPACLRSPLSIRCSQDPGFWAEASGHRA